MLLHPTPFLLSSCDLKADSFFLLTEFLFSHIQAPPRIMDERVSDIILKAHLFSVMLLSLSFILRAYGCMLGAIPQGTSYFTHIFSALFCNL